VRCFIKAKCRFTPISAGKAVSVCRDNLLPCLRRPVAVDAFRDIGFEHCCFAHSCDGWDEHILVLLHGFGDTDSNFVAFGSKLQLPQTAVLAIRAPIPLLDMGFTWFDVLTPSGDISFDSPQAIASLRDSASSVLPLLQRLQRLHGYALRNVFMLGYAQGGTVALSVLQSMPSVAIGGVISISGPPPPPPPNMQHTNTPVLFTLGGLDSCAAEKSRAWSQFELKWRSAPANGTDAGDAHAHRAASDRECCMLLVEDKGEAIVCGAKECQVLMEFFGRHLNLRSLQLCVRTRCCSHARLMNDSGGRYAQADVIRVDGSDTAATEMMAALAGDV
jgi:predicted esterase